MQRALSLFALAACHVTSRSVITRPGTVARVPHPEHAIALRPALVLTDAGQLRFVEPLECPTDELDTPQRAEETTIGPNLATFVVGVIATAAGGILLVRGLNDDDGASNPFTFGGAGGLAAGLPFAIGPWIGNSTELVELHAAQATIRPGPAQPCGERPLAAGHATLSVRGVDVYGAIDRDGVFAVSPYSLVDAYEPPSDAWNITAHLEPARTIEAVIDGPVLAERAKAFLAHADFDTKVEPIRIVPGLVAGTLRVSLAQTADGMAARIVLPLKNDGPGPAFAVRAHVVAPTLHALDGRVLYVGHLEKGAGTSRELLVPLAPSTADALRNATVDISVELRDAHGTAPTTPVRFHGALLVDAPR